jgi:hypothetical protein
MCGPSVDVTARAAAADAADAHAAEQRFHPVPYDPAKPPPAASDIAPEEWFAYMSHMHAYEGVHCEEKPKLEAVYDYLRSQFDRERSKMRYERIIGGLFKVNSARDSSWYGYCIEHVLQDGNPEPHPRMPGTMPRKFTVSRAAEGGVVKHFKPTRHESPFPSPHGLEHGGLSRLDFQSHRVGDAMMNLCQCDCKAKPELLATGSPLGCTCFCSPQAGQRGITGVHGPQGERGDRGGPGKVGGRGGRGGPGRLRGGTYPFGTCDCYNQDWEETMATKGWSECLKPGYVLQGVWRDAGSGIENVHVAKCCRPCLQISNEPPRPTLKYTSRPSTAVAYEGMSPAAYATVFKGLARRTKGHCDRLISDFRHETNRRTCFHEGSDANVATRIVLRLSPTEVSHWRFRFGADFDQGGAIVVDGAVWADGSGTSLTWDRNWASSEGVLYTKAHELQPDQWHKVVIYGFSKKQGQGVMEFEFDNGNGWRKVSISNIVQACRPATQNSGA